MLNFNRAQCSTWMLNFSHAWCSSWMLNFSGSWSTWMLNFIRAWSWMLNFNCASMLLHLLESTKTSDFAIIERISCIESFCLLKKAYWVASWKAFYTWIPLPISMCAICVLIFLILTSVRELHRALCVYFSVFLLLYITL